MMCDRKPETILVVDDEPDLLSIVEVLLEDAGYSVLCAGDGQKAASVYENSDRRIDLVLSDLEVPELNGKDLFLRLKAANPNVRAVLSSGHLDEGFKEEMLQAGVRGFLPKPFLAEDLLETVQRVLEGG